MHWWSIFCSYSIYCIVKHSRQVKHLKGQCQDFLPGNIFSRKTNPWVFEYNFDFDLLVPAPAGQDKSVARRKGGISLVS